tara:strand:- start:923 stop:1804 length:882 start_codon:yes stop_codon:yes gene_type:complete
LIDQLKYHSRFSAKEFDDQYNLRAGRPDYEVTVIPNWELKSASVRQEIDCNLNIIYGSGENQKIDIFYCGEKSAPTLLYFHGGYWQRGNKSIYSFLAKPYTSSGVNVVIVGYDLCPDVSITRISEEAREAILFVWKKGKDFKLNPNRIVVMGHSAGGHITQMMMGTKWSNLEIMLPNDLIKAGIPISPLSYLEPVRLTEALNAGIRMDELEAETQSPMTQHPPVTNAPQLVAVGGLETTEFHRQAQMYVDAYNSKERIIKFFEVPNVDHFDELNILEDSQSSFFKETIRLIKL